MGILKQNRKAGIWLFVAALTFYILISHGEPGQGYDNESYYTAVQLVEYGQPSVYGSNPPYYARNGLIEPLLLVPWYLFAKYLGWVVSAGLGEGLVAAWFNPLLTALTILYIYLFNLKLGFGRQGSLIGALLAAFTSLLVPYSRIGMETLQTLAAVMTAYYLYSFKEERHWRDLVWAGLTAAVVLGSKRTALILLLPLSLYLIFILWSHWKKRLKNIWLGLLIWSIPIAFSFILMAWFNSIRSGNAGGNLLSYYSAVADFRLLGLYSYLFSLNKSIFLYSPTIILALFGWRGFWREHKAEAYLFAALAIITLIIPATTVAYGDEVWGPRYLHILVPFGYIIGSGLFQAKVHWSKGQCYGLIALAFLGGFVQFLGSIYGITRYINVLLKAGLANTSYFGEVAQTSQILVHLQMLISQVSHFLFNTSLYFDYKRYYALSWTLPDDPRLIEVLKNEFWRLDSPQPELIQFAVFDHWLLKILNLPDNYLKVRHNCC
jgi:hypothetical protein